MTVVVDSAVVVGALVDGGATGSWAASVLSKHDLVAPHLMPVEVANILRRSQAAGLITADSATLAHLDLLDLPVSLVPYLPFAGRAWALRANLTSYDAWYVALAEALGCPLATLDRRLAGAPGPLCPFLVPSLA